MRIRSKLKATVAAVALATLPVAVHSAGLGRLNVLSGLGQPLRAEIDLVAVQAAEIESLRAGLAAPDSYREAQIEYPSSSLGLRFSLDKRSNGQYFISVNSSQSVNEPALNFLIELKWEGGRVLREYTALLDPVGYNAATTTAPVAASRPATQPVAQPVQATAPKPVAPKPEPAKQPQPQPVAEEAPGDAGAYTVRTGDTLVGVARMNMVEGVSLEQMLVGIYRANQGAFDGKNMNRLRKGKILNIPDKDALSSITPSEAAQEIRVQAQDWRAYRAKLADSAGASQAEATPGAGKITAKVEDKVKAPESAGKDTLKLSKGEDGKLKERVQTLEEESTARQKALAEASQRVSELEKTNKKLEELLALKSKQGADLQKQAEAAKAAKPVAVEPAKPVVTAPPLPTPVPAEATPAPGAVTAAPAVEAPLNPEAGAPVVAEPAPPVVAPVEPPKPKKKRPPIVIPEPEPEPSLLEDPMVLGAGGLALALLAGGGLWFARRRKKGSFEDSVITGSDLKSNTMVGNTGGAVISTGVTENSFLTDFSRAGLGTIDTDEVDPIAEAEVYMAYGRDAQAEEILKDALTRDGSRQEVRLKLLEIYSARKNAAAFESTARELYSGTQGQGPLWAQAAEMGRALDPQNSLYQQQAPVDTGALDKTMILSAGTLGEMAQETARFAQPAAEASAAGLDLDFQLDAGEAAQPAAGDSLDFDLGLGAEPAAPAEAPLDLSAGMPDMTPPPVAAEAEMDFDIGEFNLDAPAAAAAPEAAADDGILSLDIPLDLPNEPAAKAAAPLDLGSDMPDFALPVSDEPLAELDTPDLAAGLDFNFDMGEAPVASPDAASADTLDMDGMGLDLDIAPEAANGTDVMDFGAELDDPVTTKIDLARAYIDMGDKEGAREILQEAMSEGNSEQKSTAESLLAQL